MNAAMGSSVLQVVFSRFASPHVNIRLDSRPVSGSVVLPGQDPSEGALLLTTGNKVSSFTAPKSRGTRSVSIGNAITCSFPS